MKKVIRNLTLLIFFLMCSFSYAQNNLEDVVYLKNGSIIRGIIIEQVPNQSLKIQTKDRNVFVYKYDEIEKMTKENIPMDNFKVTDLKNGFINLTEINYCPGFGDVKVYGGIIKENSEYTFGFRTVNGYQLNEHLSLGVGVGIDKYKSTTFLPITFDARATILKGKISPIFTASVGYAVGLDYVKGGLVVNPQIGIKTYISKNVAYLFSVGCKWQDQDSPPFSYQFQSTENANYQFITINTGFAFF